MSEEKKDKVETKPVENSAEESTISIYLNKAKEILSALPKWERVSFFSSVAYLFSLYALNFVKVTSSNKEYLDYMGDDVSSKFKEMGGSDLWFTLSLVAAIVLIVLPFISTIAPKFKLPVQKSLIYFVGGIVAALAPACKYLFTEDKSTTFYGTTIKIVPTMGFYVILALGAVSIYAGIQMGGHKLAQAQLKKAQQAIQAKQAAAKETKKDEE